MPSGPVFAIPTASMKELLVMLVVGLAWWGVFAFHPALPVAQGLERPHAFIAL